MFYRQTLWLFLVLSTALVCAMPPAHAAARVTLEKDRVYATVDGVDLLYDFAMPPEGKGPFPFVLCIHAGGWQLGNKKSYRDIVKELAGRGYAAATIEYRRTPKHKWPAQLEDVQRAVDFFRANAAKYKIDPARIGVVGDDAGAHLALMLALTAAKEDAGKPVAQSHRVQAVVNFFAPLDLREWRVTSAWVETKIRIGFMKSSEQIIIDFLGTGDRSAPVDAEVSPITQVVPGAPPILTFIGSEDPLVPVAQAQAFHAALKQAGAEQELVVVEGQDHDRENINHDDKAFERMYAFFDKHLKK
ncbi:MAG: alpha/beta hydrolase [Candidatus Hydrogenedentes bacterium]|nr:alpha/beta hydrolase [Candidatus Hydrogenedentota bacterium]